MEQEVLGTPVFEWVGYIASAAVLISFLMKKMKTLRLVNTLGCLLFIAYGALMPSISWPIVITNVAIVSINLFYLFKASRRSE